MQRCRDAEMQRCRDAEMQRCRDVQRDSRAISVCAFSAKPL
jgi:hypothetical protein